jgi:hypothetical protein
MNKSFADLSNLETQDLIKELQNRGYDTQLLFSREDVRYQLNSINENREGLGLDDTKIELTDQDMEDILDYVLGSDILNEMINEKISDKIYDYE